MCKKVVYPEMNQEVRMEVIDGDVYFPVMDIAHCMKRHPSNFTKSSLGFEINKRRFRDESKRVNIVGIDKDTVHFMVNRSRGKHSDFLSWFDKVYEENRPAPIPEAVPETTVVPTDVPAVMQGFDKDKLKAFFEGAQEFFGMCAKLIA